ncbi:MAG: acetate--CoA ligase family protein [Sandaracinus sp.]
MGDPEIAIDVSRAAAAIGLAIDPRVVADPLVAAAEAIAEGARVVGVVAESVPRPKALLELSRKAAATKSRIVLGCLAPRRAARELADLAGDLGIVATVDVRPFAGALALIAAKADQPWNGTLRALRGPERARLEKLRRAERASGRIVRADDGLLAWESGDRQVVIGEPEATEAALVALADAATGTAPGRARIEGVDATRVTEVLFGPPRALSDPASKAALAPFGLPLPLEELCSSPSRAAAEAARIGFPVKISLASPDLRSWDHPDLSVDGIDSAARVRDVFRQIMAVATERRPDARLLGVHVTATTQAIALLGVVAEPLGEGAARAQISFADPHGIAAGDATATVLPVPPERLEQVIGRLAGSSLVLGVPAAQRKAALDAIADVLLRLTALLDTHREEIASVELRPLALLLGGSVEVREACITVADVFVRRMST